MKIAITGHLNGIGKGLFNLYNSKGFEVVGFDILDGYDILKDKDKIINKSLDCNIFINNAFDGKGQLDLLSTWHKVHFNCENYIVNMCTIATDLLFYSENINNAKLRNEFDRISLLSNGSFQSYCNFKKDLAIYSKSINSSGSKCRSISIMPNWADTDLTKRFIGDSEELKKLIGEDRRLSVDSIVASIDLVISSISKESYISSITLSK